MSSNDEVQFIHEIDRTPEIKLIINLTNEIRRLIETMYEIMINIREIRIHMTEDK